QNQLLMASIEQKFQMLNPIPFASAVDFKTNRKYLKYAIPPFMIMALIFVLNDDILKDSTNRLINHNKEFIPPAPFEFTIINDDFTVVQHEEIEIRVKVTG